MSVINLEGSTSISQEKALDAKSIVTKILFDLTKISFGAAAGFGVTAMIYPNFLFQLSGAVIGGMLGSAQAIVDGEANS
jgi:hypothetical protein